MSTQPDTMRAAFEADVTKELAQTGDYSRMFERDLTGKYLPYTLQKRWDSWQAATAHATAAERERAAKVCETQVAFFKQKSFKLPAWASGLCAKEIRKGEALEGEQ